MPEGFDFGVLDKIIKDTMAAIEASKSSLFEIAETAKNVHVKMESDLASVIREIKTVIATVDRLEDLYKRARLRLIDVSKDFSKYTEEDIKKSYARAQELQVQLAVEREREKNLRAKRDEMSRSMARVDDIVSKAEDMGTKVDFALTYLGGNLNELNQQVEDAHQRTYIGSRIILAQEEERKRVAREIHDGPAQAMANVVLRAELCEKLLLANRAEINGELHELKKIVKDSLKEVRRIIFNLRPMTLDDLGLVPTLKRYLEELKERDGFEAALEVRGAEKRLKSSYEVALFRLVQEALNNCKKYAQASQVKVLIQFTPELIEVKIGDNGRGFDLQKVLSEATGKESFGLLSMKERIELLNGKITIDTAPGQGTHITVSIAADQAEN